MKPLGSIAALIAAVRDDAAEEADAVESEARQTIARSIADDVPPSQSEAQDQRFIDAARDRARVRVAQEDWEDTRDALAQRELWMRKAIDLGTRRLRESRTTSERRDTLDVLAHEALARLPVGPVEIVVAEADAAALDGKWVTALVGHGAADTACIVIEEVDGGCIVRLRDGRASFDNTYAARAERLQSAWRAALADLYERATSGISSPVVPPAEG